MKPLLFLFFSGLIISKVSWGQIDSSNAFALTKGYWHLPIEKIKRVAKYEDYQYGNGCYFGKSMTFYADVSSEVKAVQAGRVVLISSYDDVNLVVISYGKYFLCYANVLNLIVSKGDWVIAGKVIGQTAKDLDDEFACELRLSFEGEELDPAAWFTDFQQRCSAGNEELNP